MVARSPSKQQRKMSLLPPHLSPTLLRETVDKVDKCMARLQELQHTVTGASTKPTTGVSSSPRSGRGYFQPGLRFKHESPRLRNGNARRSPTGKLPAVTSEDWRRMSLPAMLLGETMGEVLQAAQFARTVVEAAAAVFPNEARDVDPTTPPVTLRRKPRANIDQLMQARRMREKLVGRSQPASDEPSLKRAKSRINFKATSPPLQRSRECEKENCPYIANRVSPRNRPWERKTVLFPNPLFNPKMSSPTKQQQQHQKLCKTTSPVFARNSRQTPHKFLIKSPPKIKSPTGASLSKKKLSSPPKDFSASSAAARIRRSFSPARLANRLASPLKSRKMPLHKSEEMKLTEIAARSRQIASYKFLIKSPPMKVKSSLISPPPKASKLRRSFSPSRLANRIVMSPFKTRSNNSMKKYEGMKIVSRGLDQQPVSSSTRF